jgi:hypothetical protein
MIRKTIGTIVAVIGILSCVWGLWLLGMSLYYTSIKDRFMGDATYLGFSFGIAFIGIGMAIALIANFIFSWKKSILYKLLFEK